MPVDGIVLRFVARVRPDKALSHKSFLYDLTERVYCEIQSTFAELAKELEAVTGATRPIRRLELEQMIWGWVKCHD